VRFSKNPQTFLYKLFIVEGQRERERVGGAWWGYLLHFTILERHYKREELYRWLEKFL